MAGEPEVRCGIGRRHVWRILALVALTGAVGVFPPVGQASERTPKPVKAKKVQKLTPDRAARIAKVAADRATQASTTIDTVQCQLRHRCTAVARWQYFTVCSLCAIDPPTRRDIHYRHECQAEMVLKLAPPPSKKVRATFAGDDQCVIAEWWLS
jgi:hypothetical protein